MTIRLNALHLIAVSVWAASNVATASIETVPDCPSILDPVVIIGRGPTLRSEPLLLEVRGSTIKLVAQTWESPFLPPFTQVQAQLPPLPAGIYRVEFYTRRYSDNSFSGDPSNLLPEVFSEAKDIRIYLNPPRCSASNVEVIAPAYATGQQGGTYSDTLRFRVTDAHGWPIPGYTLQLSRVWSPDELVEVVPDFAAPGPKVLTDVDGVAMVTGVPNNVPGSFQYKATVATPIGESKAFVTFYNQPVHSALPSYPVVEFVRYLPNGQPHFFMTGIQHEMVKLDDTSDWMRTGAVFMTFPPGSNRPGTSGVCRYYGLPAAGLDSHFFSASRDECNAVRERFAYAWKVEAGNVFEVYLPNQESGACPVGTTPLHRAYNNQPDANHRYARTAEVALAGGPLWTLEGYGTDAIVMCLPE